MNKRQSKILRWCCRRYLLRKSARRICLCVVAALIAVGAVVVERWYKGQEKQFKLARAMAAVSLVVGMVNAFMV